MDTSVPAFYKNVIGPISYIKLDLRYNIMDYILFRDIIH